MLLRIYYPEGALDFDVQIVLRNEGSHYDSYAFPVDNEATYLASDPDFACYCLIEGGRQTGFVDSEGLIEYRFTPECSADWRLLTVFGAYDYVA